MMLRHFPQIFCTVIFVDLIESSLFSKILSVEEYANIVELFQDIAKKIYENFRSTNIVNSEKYYMPETISPRGDEAVIYFSTNTSTERNPHDIELAVKLALQIKFEWKKELISKGYESKRHIDLAIGINRGQVAAKMNEDMRIVKVEGYEINYAKRVESYSRIGKYTNIFLSEKSRKVLKNVNIIFEKYEDCSLKGIEEKINLYEVNEFIFDELPYVLNENLQESIEIIIKTQFPTMNKAWLEQYIISILYSELSKKYLDYYKKKILRLINDSRYQNRILYKFLKAYFLDDTLLLLKLKYYQEIVKENSSFIAARKEIIRLYEKLSEKMIKLEPIALQVKNYIDEMYNFNKELIEPDEREMYDRILLRINTLITK